MTTVFKPPFKASPNSYTNPLNKPTLMFLLHKYGKLVIASETSSTYATAETIYSVPRGKVFYLLNATVSVETTNNALGIVYLLLYPRSGGVVGESSSLVRLQCGPTAAATNGPGQTASSFNPCFPILVKYTEELALYNAAAIQESSISIVGYEIDEEIVKEYN